MNWEIVGPNSQEALPSQNRDIADPVSGSFFFGDGEGGMRSIILAIYPHDDIEIEKTFIIKLKLVRGEAQLDSTAKDVTLTVSLTLFFPQNLGFKGSFRKRAYICWNSMGLWWIKSYETQWRRSNSCGSDVLVVILVYYIAWLLVIF